MSESMSRMRTVGQCFRWSGLALFLATIIHLVYSRRPASLWPLERLDASGISYQIQNQILLAMAFCLYGAALLASARHEAKGNEKLSWRKVFALDSPVSDLLGWIAAFTVLVVMAHKVNFL